MNMTQNNKKQLLEDLKNPGKALNLLNKSVENPDQWDSTFIFENIIGIYNINIFRPKKTIAAKHHAICEIANQCKCNVKITEDTDQIVDSIKSAMSMDQRERFEKAYDEFRLTCTIFNLITAACTDAYNQSFSERNKYLVLR